VERNRHRFPRDGPACRSGDIPFDGISDPCDLIKQAVGDALDAGHHLISLGGDRAALAYGSSHAS